MYFFLLKLIIFRIKYEQQKNILHVSTICRNQPQTSEPHRFKKKKKVKILDDRKRRNT